MRWATQQQFGGRNAATRGALGCLRGRRYHQLCVMPRQQAGSRCSARRNAASPGGKGGCKHRDAQRPGPAVGGARASQGSRGGHAAAAPPQGLQRSGTTARSTRAFLPLVVRSGRPAPPSGARARSGKAAGSAAKGARGGHTGGDACTRWGAGVALRESSKPRAGRQDCRQAGANEGVGHEVLLRGGRARVRSRVGRVGDEPSTQARASRRLPCTAKRSAHGRRQKARVRRAVRMTCAGRQAPFR